MFYAVTRRLLAIVLVCAGSTVLAQGIGTQLLSELADQGLADTLDSYGPMLIVPAGNELYVGNITQPKINRFTVDAAGALSFTGSTLLNTLGATLTSAREFQMNASGNVLYVAGDHRIAVMTRNPASGVLNLATTIAVDATLTISDLALSNDGLHLYVVSNNYTFETQQGRSSLRRYDVAPTSGSLSLAATRAEPMSSTPLTSINVPSASELVFVGKRSMLEVSRRNFISGALGLLQTHTGVGRVTSTATGDWLIAAQYLELSIYQVDTQSGQITRTQHLRSELPPMPTETLYAATEIALNAAEDRLIVTGYVQVGVIAGGIRAIASTDVLVRNPANGRLRYDGIGVRAGSRIVRHPTEDWFYTFIPSFSQTGGFQPTMPVLAQQGLLPTPAETSIVAAVLPNSRAEGDRQNRTEAVTAFATVLNPGRADALSCRAGLLRESVRGLKFRVTTTDPVTNAPMNYSRGFFDVPAGGATQLIFEIRTEVDPQAQAITRVPELLDVRFFCRNAQMTERVTGVTTFAFASDTQPLPDLLTATASPDRPGVVSLPTVDGQSFFTVATINLGAGALISATGAVELAGSINGAEPLENPPALRMQICETDSATSQCKAPFGNSVERIIDANEVVTYTLVVQGQGQSIAFRPDIHRAFVLLKDVDGNLRGGSSVAVETQ